MVTANAAALLLQHYVDNCRRLPWRSAPGDGPPDPYRIGLSEIMLQQTTVAAVASRFERFVRRWPTVQALAAAPDEEILSEWAGLGYYARARNLIAAAHEVAAKGSFPATLAGLRQLPGVGAYTAAAIAAIAFGEQAAAVDTNVRRVIARLHALRQPSTGEIEALVLDLIPPGRAGDFTQAMMDLGATVCRPTAPLCGRCPLRRRCAAVRGGDPEAYPAPKPRRQRPHKFGLAFWTERDGHVWLVRRPPRGLLGGMAALPGSEWTEQPAQLATALGTVRYVFTHFSLDLHVVRSAEPVGDGWWQPLGRLADAGLPTLYRRACEIAIGAAAIARAAA
jgi:A/G-specific adenine glycosylase